MRVDPELGHRIGPFTVLKKLGEGSFGAVYKVRGEDGSIVALKLLRLFDLYPIRERSNVAKRFALEFETGKIESPYLVESYDIGEEKGNPFFTMLYCAKGSLENFSGTKVNADYGRSMAIDILLGLKALHSNGKIHRDLKPQNILVDAQEHIRLTDFGIAGHLNLGHSEDGGKKIRLTTTDILGRPRERFGSYPYMPPEQLKPTNLLVTKLAANDIFSFGVTIYQVMTGKFPFGDLGNNDAELVEYIARVHQGKWTCITQHRPDLGVEWKQMIDGCLQPDYKRRFSAVDEILSLLGARVPEVRKEAVTGVQLKVLQGEEHGKVYGLQDLLKEGRGTIVRIGRKDLEVRNDIELKDDLNCYISRRHATLERGDSDTWFIRDGQWIREGGRNTWKRSVNGTFLNGKEIDLNGARILSGDILTMGETTLKFMK
jgi:serine/threonine protein kinase